MIENYHFGSITIDGDTYTQDVEVRWDGKVLEWWRKEGHLFALGDLKRALSQNPEVLILGTGAYGKAEVGKSLQKEVRERDVDLIIEKTNPAVKKFNQFLEREAKVIGLFHLTC